MRHLKVLVLAGLLALAACAQPVVMGRGAPSVPASTNGTAFVMPDGAALPYRTWQAERPHAVLIGVHGLNDYSGAFRYPGPWFAEHGVTVYAYDQRGFGQAPGRGLWAGEAALAADLRDVIALVRARHPGVPVHVAGLSMGGAVAMTALSGDGAPPVEGLVLVAPAVWGLETMPDFYRAALDFVVRLAPWWPMSGDGTGIRASDNMQALIENGRDPLFLKQTRADVVFGLVRLMDAAQKAAGQVKPPVLLLYGEKDALIPKEAVAQVAERLPDGARIALYPDGWHMLLRDLQRETVYRDILGWIGAPGAPLPSGAEAGPGLQPLPR
mgnify:CR=1 FL=1